MNNADRIRSMTDEQLAYFLVAITEPNVRRISMSWKFVFNGGNLIGKTILDIADAAIKGGYDFFSFNGDVYFCSEGRVHKTKITTKDLI